jgi:hypothetical protein
MTAARHRLARLLKEFLVQRWLGIALLAGALAVAAPMAQAAAAPAQIARQKVDAAKASDFSARRYHRRDYRYGYGTDYTSYPHYYARPYYYRPYPYSSPAPFTFGFGFGPLW